MEIAHRTIRNSLYSMFGYVWPIAFSLLITPVVVHSMGIKIYGIYTFINTVMSMLGLLDLGFSTAASKYLSEYKARDDRQSMRVLAGTTVSITTIIGIVGLLVFLFGALLVTHVDFLNEYTEYRTGLIAAGLTFFFSLISSIYSIGLNAYQRFDIGTKVGISVMTAQQLSALGLVLAGYSINAIMLAQLAISILSFMTQYLIFHKSFRDLPYKFGWDKLEAIKYYKFGLVTFLNNLATTSLTYLDRLIIPFFLGPSNLTYYSLPGNIATKIPGASNSMTSVLFPMASGFSGVGDTERLRTLYVRSFRLIFVMASALTTVTIAFADKILTHWISADLAEKATGVLIILALTNFILAFTGPLSNFLLGLGKLKFITTFSILMAGLNTILLVVLLPLAGIQGAAWAYLFSVIPTIYMLYFTEKHYLKLATRKLYYFSIILKNLTVSLIVGSVSFFIVNQYMSNIGEVVIYGGLMILVYFGIYWLLGFFEKEDRESFILFARKALRMA